MLPAFDLMFLENNPAGVKAFMATKNLCHNQFRLPVVPVSAGTQEKIEEFVKEYC
jgi:4-hydroxy-tetrahydrodipicolinate synthase